MNYVIFRPFEETIAAGERKVINAYSKMITVLSNTGTDDIKVGFGEDNPVAFKAGLSYELPQGERFTRIVLSNDSAAEVTVEFVLSVGRVYDNRLVLAGSVFSDIETATELSAALLQGSLDVPTYGAVACISGYVVLAEANANRVGYSVENPASNSLAIYIGYDNTVTPTNYAYSIQPGSFAQGEKFRGKIYIACTGVQNVMVTEFVK